MKIQWKQKDKFPSEFFFIDQEQRERFFEFVSFTRNALVSAVKVRFRVISLFNRTKNNFLNLINKRVEDVRIWIGTWNMGN